MRWILVVASALGLLASASATVFTFESATGSGLGANALNGANGGAIYGNRVASAVENGFSYGSAFGFTPNVAVSYSASGTNQPSTWSSGYGDLLNVIWGSGSQSTLTDNVVSVTFTADPGWFIDFRGFSVARWSTGNYPGSFVTLTNADNVTVDLMAAQQLVSGTSTTFAYGDDTYLSTSFVLRFGNGWWTGIDNVAIQQQPVPEPMTMTLLAAGLVAVARRRRKA
jgi:hypothetical protein